MTRRMHKREGGAAAACAVALTLIWLTLCHGDPHSLWVGIPVILLGTAAYLSVSRSIFVRWRLAGAVRLALYFLWQSILSGVDVVRRVLSPSLPMQAELIRFDLRLQEESAGVLFANAVSLLPGTLSCRLEDDHILVHVLDTRVAFKHSLMALERRIAHLQGQELAGEGSGTRFHPYRVEDNAE